MAQTYKSRAGDVVDDIAWRQYGVVNETILSTVLEANPGLAGYGPVLPAGVDILLPDIEQTTPASEGVKLWT